jgi:threonine/homoserine/homoserine lactone efflux protein
MSYFLGLAMGLVPALSTGPVFLTLIQNSISHGFKNTVYFIIGVALTDTSILLLTWFGLSQFSGESESSPMLLLGGGILLIVFGLGFILKKEKEEKENEKPNEKPNGHLHKLGLFTQAIMLNAINPIVWGFWTTISNYAITEFQDQTSELIFFVGILNMILITDLLKAYYAQRLKSVLTADVKKYIRIGIGIVLCGLGIKMLLEYGGFNL